MAFTTREKLEPSRRMYEKMSPLDGMERMELMKSTIETNWMEFKNSAFVAREGDVFIATFPRCGTAWVQQISKLIRNSGVEDGTGIDEAFPWIDLMSPEEAETIVFPRGFKTHFPYKYMLGGEPALSPAKYICIYRNPKDTAVSFYYQAKSLFKPDIQWDEFVEQFMTESTGSPSGNYLDYVAEWWKHKDSANILLVSYESLKRNHRAAVETIANFMSCKLSPDTLNKIVDQTMFDAVKKNPAANMHWVDKISLDGSSVEFMRRGIVGDWESHFTDDQSATMDQIVKRKLSGTGLEFEY